MKTFVYKLFIKRPQLITVEKKNLFFSLPCFGQISLQTRTKLRKSLKEFLNSCKLQIVFRNQRKLSHVFRFKHCLSSDLVSGAVYKHTCGRCNPNDYGETDRHLKIRSWEHIGISPLTMKKTKPSKENAICDHLLNCNNIPLLRSLPIWQTGIINSCLESKKVYLSNEIDLFWIKVLVLLNCFFLTIVSFLIVSLYSNIAWLQNLIV